ncbi:MAG: GTPase domain-containing protein [Planctomycetes bacterium]|nr:GTPase domain-containing protein [Planctomycetota bacterium]
MIAAWDAALRRALAVLEAGPRTIAPAIAANLAGRTREILEKLRLADDRIVVGLVGGTGVGKSTLINALAGAEISRASERRPTTERAVIYRHASFACDAGLEPGEREESVHEIDDLRDVAIVDFPDFDGCEPRHLDLVGRSAGRLDLLVVITDIEKYADGSLYRFLAALPQARANHLFVLNKTDLLERLGIRAGSALAEVTEDFQTKLRQYARRRESEVHALSAAEALRARLAKNLAPAAWQAFDGRIRALREEKRRRRIRRDNIGEAIRRLAAAIVRAANPPARMKAIASLRGGLGAARTAWARLATEAAGAPFGDAFRRAFAAETARRASTNWGPLSRALSAAVAGRRSGEGPALGTETLADASARFRRRFAFQREQLADRVRRALPGVRIESTPPRLDLSIHADTVSGWLEDARQKISARFRRKWPNAALPIAASLTCLGVILRPAIESMVRLGRAGELRLGDIAWRLLSGAAELLNPVNIVASIVLVGIAFAYGVIRRTSAIRGRADRAVDGCRDRLAEGLRSIGEREAGVLAGEIDRAEAESAEIRDLLRGLRPDPARGSAPREAPRPAV